MQKGRKIIIGSRCSALSVSQSNIIKNLIIDHNPFYKDNPNLIEIKGFKTIADRILDKNLCEIGGKGLFTKEIEDSLLDASIDIAVHSMKDMATICHPKLTICSVSNREDVRDAFISNKYQKLQDLPNGAIIGTSSLRRKALILKLRPDLKIVNFRGNILTRLSKLDEGTVDATILSYAGLKRLNIENRASQIFETNQILPAPAQGAIAVQIQKGNDVIAPIIESINDSKTKMEVEAERLFLRLLDGSCKTPIAAFCQINNSNVSFKGLIATFDGQKIFNIDINSNIADYIQVITDKTLEIKKQYEYYHRN